MEEKFDVIIVGGGLSGLACAHTLSKKNINVAVLERGDFSGSKNVIGGVLYTSVLSDILPDFYESASLERMVTEKKFSLLSNDSEISFKFRTTKYKTPPFNNAFTVLRSKFDRWFAGEVEKSGAMILTGVKVKDLLWEEPDYDFLDKKDFWKKPRCLGIKTEQNETLFSDCVILAEGANSFLAEKSGLKKKPHIEHMAIAVKEIIRFSKEEIDTRFGLADNEGVAWEYFGESVKGVFGSGFIYTNEDTISVGVGCTLQDFIKLKKSPNEILEGFKSHPCIRNYISGGEIKEYSAHLIPEGGFEKLPQLVHNNLMITGDCGGLVNGSHFHEGTNLAMASGVYAAETFIKAKEKNDFSAEGLTGYNERLNNSFIMKDIKKFRNFTKFFKKHPEVLNSYPGELSEILNEYFLVTNKPKEEIEKQVIKRFKKKIGLMKSVRSGYGFLKGMDSL